MLKLDVILMKKDRRLDLDRKKTVAQLFIRGEKILDI